MTIVRWINKSLGWGLLTLALMMPEAWAQALAKPKGPVVLTVSGRIAQHNTGGAAEFDLAMLNALPVHEFATKNPWKEPVMTYTGPSLKTLLRAVGASGRSLRLIALDKYEATVPMDDVERFNPMLALRVDGKPLTVRTLGPVQMMYPFDQYPEINVDLYSGRAVWQLRRIVVE